MRWNFQALLNLSLIAQRFLRFPRKESINNELCEGITSPGQTWTSMDTPMAAGLVSTRRPICPDKVCHTNHDVGKEWKRRLQPTQNAAHGTMLPERNSHSLIGNELQSMQPKEKAILGDFAQDQRVWLRPRAMAHRSVQQSWRHGPSRTVDGEDRCSD